jgi:hypothetical protein
VVQSITYIHVQHKVQMATFALISFTDVYNMRYDTLSSKNTISNHLWPRDNFYFYFYFFIFYFYSFLEKKKKKTLKLARGLPYHMSKVIKSCVLGWENIISLQYREMIVVQLLYNYNNFIYLFIFILYIWSIIWSVFLHVGPKYLTVDF